MCLGISAQSLFTVSGKIQLVSYSQGGVELPPMEYMASPLPNTNLYVVQYLGKDEVSKVIAKVKSDENGNYEVKLPPGKYGFVEHKNEVGKGVYLPGWKAKTGQDSTELEEVISLDYYVHEYYWVLSTGNPFEIINTDLQKIDITHYDLHICYLCP